MTDAIFTTTCARCAAPLESTDATADAVSKAHEATCIIPGDEVRWDYAGNWIEGKLDSIITKSYGSIAYIDVVGTSFNDSVRRQSVGIGGSATFRRIPRPEPVVAPDSKVERQTFAPGDVAEWRLDGLTWERVTVVRAYPGDKFEIEHHRTASRWQVHRSEMRRVAREGQATDALDVKYDDVTLRVLLGQNACNSQEAGPPLFLITPAQRAAVSAHWSAQLRARLAASKERERLTVIAPDLELETANCKDAE